VLFHGITNFIKLFILTSQQNPFISLNPVKINSKIEITAGAYILSFPRFFDFEAGQVVGIGMKKDADARVYSIASGVNEKQVDILFEVKPAGQLTPQLANCKPGDTIYVSEPFGSFLATEDPAWWLASGTGIAPYRSMLRSGFINGKRLLHGARTLDHCYFREELLSALQTSYLACVSREAGIADLDVNTGGIFNGRITTYLGSLEEIPKDILYYLCGSAEFVVDTREVLFAKGVGYEKVVSEIYF
jgi:ferredoxin/flavodoxin---NADP+ reductase